MFTTFSEIYEQLATKVGQTVSITGHLLIGKSDKPFLALDYDGYKRGERLAVSDNNVIAKHLLRTLPAYGGGDVIYNELAFLTATIVVKDGDYELDDLRFCKIVRDDVEIIVPSGLKSSLIGLA